jgi:uncharacterized protein with PIN domain
MFVDASAIVAILTREPDADVLADLLEAAIAPARTRSVEQSASVHRAQAVA